MRHLKWLCLLCVVALMLLPQLAWAQGDEASFKPTGDVSIGYWFADGETSMVSSAGDPGWQSQADADARPWMARGEYRFAPRWSGEALVASGDIRTGPWSAWPIGQPGDGESGRDTGDLRMWAANVYYNVWRSPQHRYGRVSTLDVGMGYQRLRQKEALEHLLPPDVAGVVSTYRYTFKGLQLGARGRMPLATQVDLKAGVLWKPDEDLDVSYSSIPDGIGSSGSGDGHGWDASLAVVYEPAPEWDVELGYRYMRRKGSVPAVDLSEVKLTQKGLYLAANYRFE